MNTLSELSHLPITEFEKGLKDYTSKHPRWHDHLLSPDELLVFLTECIPHLHRMLIDGLDLDTPEGSAALKTRINDTFGHDNFPVDRLPKHEADFYAYQKEGYFIPPEFDISVGRMTRYMPAHWHTNDYFELYYVFSGKCQLCFENETVDMTPGTIFLLSPSTVHASPCYRDDAVLFYYMIRTSTFNMIFWNQLSDQNLMSSFFRKVLNGEKGKSYLHFETGQDEEIRSLLYDIYQEYVSSTPYRSQMMNSLMGLFFIQLLRKYENTIQLPADHTLHWKSNYAEIFSYIQNHYITVTLKELSDHFHYSERQLARIIQSCTGSNFSDFLLKLRMNQAASYLTHTSLPTEIISQKVGYENSSSFYRAFMKFYGYSPKKYRKNNIFKK